MRILIIQTAFIGDVVLATPIAEKMHRHFPKAEIDFLVRKGNEGLFDQHPFIAEVLTLDKKNKLKNLWKLIPCLRSRKYDLVVNTHRFFTSALVTLMSGADQTVGFSSSWLSLFFTYRFPHVMGGQHEVNRNLSLIENITDGKEERPRLYTEHVLEEIRAKYAESYYVIAPGSVWETKKVPLDKWVALIKTKLKDEKVYLIGGNADISACEQIVNTCDEYDVESLAGKLNLLESVALIQNAQMNYTNDSAPMHFASAVNAPVTAVFCSTIPAFGFGPLSDISFIAETSEILPCRPCGLHGKMYCPKGHFLCGNTLSL